MDAQEVGSTNIVERRASPEVGSGYSETCVSQFEVFSAT